MINHIWSVLCRKSVIDGETNNLSIFDVLEQVSIDAKVKKGAGSKDVKINVPIEYEVVSFWSKSHNAKASTSAIKLEIINPDGKVEKTFEQPLEIPEDKKRLRSRIRIKGFVAEDSGVYIFKISYKDNKEYVEAANLPFEVILKKEFVNNVKKTRVNRPIS